MERDDETGLNYHNARYYIPWLGRWLSPDPIGIGDGVNVYSYCGNNSISNNDKEGTQVNTGAVNTFKVSATNQKNIKTTSGGILPWAEFNNLFGVKWTSYNTFTNNEKGKKFSESFISLYSTNKIFEEIYNQLDSSSNYIKVAEMPKTKKFENAAGAFVSDVNRPSLTGSKENPFLLLFSGTAGSSTIFEEFFHAGQRDFYGKNEPDKMNPLQIEVEAKVAKAIAGIRSEQPYEAAFFDNAIVKQYATALKEGKAIDIDLEMKFSVEVSRLAYNVFQDYDARFWHGQVSNQVLIDFTSYLSLDYFNSIFEPVIDY